MRDIVDALIDAGIGIVVVVASVVIFVASMVWLLASWGVVFNVLGG